MECDRRIISRKTFMPVFLLDVYRVLKLAYSILRSFKINHFTILNMFHTRIVVHISLGAYYDSISLGGVQSTVRLSRL